MSTNVNTQDNNLHRQPHLTESLIMVEPLDFGFNPQTGLDNEFQHQPSSNQSEEIKLSAQKEFNQMVEKLSRTGLEIITLGKPHTKAPLPDAVFPNNWFSTRNDGTLFIYPMKTENRKAEVQQDSLSQKLSGEGYQIKKVMDLRNQYQPKVALEGTGSLIFHHPSSQVFAAISERCDPEAFKEFCDTYGYRANLMQTKSAKGTPIYHTNVLMSCGENFALIAEPVISDDISSQQTLSNLRDIVSDVITISEAQMAENFCGNILQVKNNEGTPLILMSQSALEGFNRAQIKTLEAHGEIVACAIPTIEYVGGGSVRCMLAENFLPRR
ncbi:arginine deiminase-related protein [Aliikangiella sp. G2MR2-5]|uniref:arginine deiminase-related protein n=1 Tax=Aliikangiella sp. G2MR2-5 TaxID=2788943 RepID=UPI0018AB1A22|nr:arginine deiminase-related protein [Aliikangiella sp. G2MR2-5]